MMPLLANIPDEVFVLIVLPLVGGVLIAITAILAGTYVLIAPSLLLATDH